MRIILVISYCQKWMATFAPNKPVLLLTAAFITLTSMLPGRANFSGKWKLNESKSARGHSLCVWGLQDHMRSNTMRVAAQSQFLTIYVTGLYPEDQVTTEEKLTFDGKERQVALGGRIKKNIVQWSPDRQTMTVQSIVSGVAGSVQPEFKVTEVWTLINNGKSISLKANIKSISGEDTMNLVFDKTN